METWFNFISGLSSEGLSMAVNGLWLGVVLTGLSWLIWRLIKTSNAATGYVVWWSVLTVVIALPFLVGRPVTDWFESRVEQPIPTISATGAPAETLPVRARVNLAGPELVTDVVSSPAENMRSDAVATHVAEAAPRTVTAVGGSAGSREENSVFSLLVKLLPISLFGIWLCVSLLFLWRLLSAHRRMVSIKRGSSPFDISGFARLNNIINQAATIRSIRVNLSSEIDFPMAAGLGHPMVLIPRRLVNQLTGGELESVILHELVHILRWDDWTKLGQKIIEALMFFNPAVFWIGRRLDLEREIACDDRVVEHLGRPGDYARCLTRLTQLTAMPVGASLIPGVLTNRKQIFKRFDRLLNGRRNGGTRFSRIHFFGAFAGIVVALAIAVRVAPVIAVPVEAVTFDELYGTVQLAAENVWSDFLADEPRDNRVLANNSDLAELGPEPKIVDEESPSAIEKNPVSEDYLTSLVTGFISAAEIVLETPAVFAVAEDPIDDSDDVAETTIRADERVVDWDDEAFRLPITGTIHGIGGSDEAIDVWIDKDKKVRAAMQGRIKFSSDRRSVRSISKGGYLAIKEQHGSIWRELDIKPINSGRLAIAYYVDGIPREYDTSARKWLARVLREMIPDIPDVPDLADISDLPDVADVPDLPDLADIPDLPDMPDVADVPDIPDFDDPRIEHRGLLSKIFDWVSDPFDDLSKGLMISHGDDDDDGVEICWSDGRNKIRVKMDGEVEFTDDDRAIKSISRHGYFAIWEKRGSKRRELDVEPDRNGVLNYGYYVNGKSQDFDDYAREWLADVLVKMIREAGINAASRARRIYEQDGVDGVLTEISQIDSDYVKRKYFDALLDFDELSDDEYSTMLGQIERELDSDYEKAQLLVDMADRVNQNKNLIRDYVDVVQTIDSDYETRRILSAMYMGDDADDDIVLAVLEIASRMDSDYEKAELLIDMAPYCRGRGDMQAAYVQAILNLDSDYETRRVLSALSLDEDADPEIIMAVLKIAGQIDSDYEKAELLIELAPNCRDNPQLQAEYVNSIIDLDSDYETRRVLSALSMDGDVDPAVLITVLDIIGRMDSDYEKAELLVEIAARNRAYARAWDTYRAAASDGRDTDYELAREAYLRAVADMSSNYEIKRVLLKLINRDELNDALVLDILSVVAKVSSDYEKSEILKQLVKYCRGKEDLEDAFLTIVDSMSSDYEAKELYTLMYRKARRTSGKYK